MDMLANNLQADAAQRAVTYRRLQGRNRLVAILRIGVPALGVLVLASLLGQIYLSSLTGHFAVGRIAVSREAVTIEAPEYSGVLDNGTTYRVWAKSAKAAIDAADQVALTEAALTMRRTTGLVTQINAVNAMLDTGIETVTIPGVAVVEESSGTSGTILDSVFDYAAQNLVGRGSVHIDYANGTTLDGVGMAYDVDNTVWTFSRVNVTMPSTPGSKKP
ncbi:MAG: hypothetical protein MO846_06970 [Candidatus Devosia symbiotica]|nr:hypothetical protein [Candidatus Devosia symbiotica]